MPKGGVLFINFLLLGTLLSCEGNDTKQGGVNNDQPGTNTQQYQVEKESFCECLEINDPKECVDREVERIVNPDMKEDSLRMELYKLDCYSEKVLVPEVERLCECLNNIHQASLECDELQREIDISHDELEKEIIGEMFRKKDCIPEL